MWNQRSDDRLREWKLFRKELDKVPFEEALTKTSHLWSYAPIVYHKVCSYDPQDFQSPWDLVSSNNGFDDFDKALGIIYTLALTNHGEGHSFKLQVAKFDSSIELCNLVLIDDGKYLLNYQFDSVLSKTQIKETYQTMYEFDGTVLQLEKY